VYFSSSEDISSFHSGVKRLQSGFMSEKSFKIGTRGSPLALKQADMLRERLQKAHPDLSIEIIPIQSAADWKAQDGERSLCSKDGGKGQFAKEIEEQILNGSLDCGVHSLKDMASFLPEGLVIDHYLPRADARDAFICAQYQTVMDLPEGAVIGTCSPRRQAFVLSKRPDLKIVPFRGNVSTRLDKVRNGQVDATYLAMAGLSRLNITDPMIHAVEIEEMLPACGQGIICIERRKDDERAQEILNAVHDPQTGLCAIAEREVLAVLDGSCHTPLAAYAIVEKDSFYVRAVVASPNGQEVYQEESRTICTSDAQAREIGVRVGETLKARLPEGFLNS
jgi:hydroxymethylbilane synthase